MLRREPREPIGAAARANAASDPDHHERIEGKAIAIVHATRCSLFVPHPSRGLRQSQDHAAVALAGAAGLMQMRHVCRTGRPSHDPARNIFAYDCDW